jgi:hypothetical protein
MNITSPPKTKSFLFAAAALIPILLCLLFEMLKHRQPLMDRWVFGVIAPIEQFWGRFWALIPISMMEVSIALALVGSAGWLLRALILLIRSHTVRPFLLRLGALLTLWLWILAGFNWLWNATYYATPFARRAGLETAPYSVETLAGVTYYFAAQTASLSAQIERDADGHFAESMEDCFARGPETYRNITAEFPCLAMRSVKAKPIFCSRLQSILGFTGMYFPFTGEANVNVDAPACLIPATITHEMAHQRLVASELEANFVGIAAAVTCGDPVVQYSGYLMGLIQLSNALYPVAPGLWQEIVNRTFTPELARDWTDNYEYWQALASPVEDAAEQVYDSFLKQNDQELGMRSYGACVDLLVAYFS